MKKNLYFFRLHQRFGKQAARTPLLVTEEQAKFIRNYRLKKMKENFLTKLITQNLTPN
jgi:hypothetical protein